MIKKIICLLIIFFGGYYIYNQDFFNIKELIRDWKKQVIVPNTTSYKKDISIAYVKNTNDFVPHNKKDLLNIYYTILNSGWNDFTFYCPDSYKTCISDVKVLSIDRNRTLSHLNSFVEPYNQYNNIYTKYFETGKVTINIKRVYDSETINIVNKKINTIYNEVVKATNSNTDNIRAIHDYVVDHTIYDENKIDNINDDTYQSNTAYGALYQGYAVCSGYADTMALFLDKMNIPNIKVATDNHVWNLVYVDNKWLHLDLTWDDPVLESGQQILDHSFFMINGAALAIQDKIHNTSEHAFDKNIYKEAE